MGTSGGGKRDWDEVVMVEEDTVIYSESAVGGLQQLGHEWTSRVDQTSQFTLSLFALRMEGHIIH